VEESTSCEGHRQSVVLTSCFRGLEHGLAGPTGGTVTVQRHRFQTSKCEMCTYSRVLLLQTLASTNTTPSILGRGRRSLFRSQHTQDIMICDLIRNDRVMSSHVTISWHSEGRMQHPQTCMSLGYSAPFPAKTPQSLGLSIRQKCSTTAVVLGLIGNYNRQKDVRGTNHWQAAAQILPCRDRQ
jgi:hypothetical protein